MVYKSNALAAGSSGGTGGGTVLSVTGLNTDNTDPTNPVVKISVDGVTITGSGTPGSPLVSTASSTGGGAVSSVFGRTGAVVAVAGDYGFSLVSGTAAVSQGGTGQATLPSHGVLLGEGTSAISAATTGIVGRLLIDQGGADPLFQPMSGDATIASTGAITLTTVNANTGTFGSASIVPIITENAKGLTTAVSVSSIAAPASLIIGSVLASNVTASSLTTVGALASGSLAVGFTPVTNALLANSAITVGAGTGLTGGGSVPLGGAVTISMANTSLTVSGVSGVTGGGTVALGSSITLGMAGNTANTLAGYNSSGVFSDVSIGSNLSLSGGILNGTVGPAAVTSVFGRTGAVTAQWNDYTFNLVGGTAAVSQGGTGQTSLTSHAVLLGEGATAGVGFATTGTAARILIDQGNADPAFKAVGGDVSAISTGAFTIGAAAVTYAKIQNESAYTVLGNNTGSATSTAAISVIILGTPGYAATGYNFAQISAGTNNFGQLSIQNTSAGSSASTDFVAAANDGDDTKFYLDMGINSSITGVAPFTNPHAAYIYVAGPELDIGAISAGGVINFYTTGGNTPVKAGFFDASQNLNLTNALAVAQGGTGQKTFTNGQLLIGNTSTTGLTPSTISAGTSISITNNPGVIGITYTGSATGVSTITNSDGSLTITPQTGVAVASLNVAHANTWTATQTSAVSGGVASFISTGSLEFSIFANGNSGAGTPTLKWDNGNIQSVTITGACTLGFALPTHPSRLTVIATMSATSGYNYAYAGTTIWPSGTKPTLSSISNARDVASFLYDGTSVYGISNSAFS